MQDMRKRIIERIKGQHQLTGDFNVKSSSSTVNTERSQAPGWNAWPRAMADVLWDKQTLTPFCPVGKDLMVARQSLWWISSAVGGFCILLKLKAAEDGLLCGLWSSPLPAADAVKTVVSLRLAWELLGPSWWRPVPWRTMVHQSLGNGMSNSLLQTQGFLAEACCERAEVLQEELAMCCGVGAERQAGLGCWAL